MQASFMDLPGLPSMNYGLLEGMVACCFGILGFPGGGFGAPWLGVFGVQCRHTPGSWSSGCVGHRADSRLVAMKASCVWWLLEKFRFIRTCLSTVFRLANGS